MKFSFNRGLLGCAEFALAGLITACLIVLHIQFCQHAGPLFRDENSGAHLATAPALTESWRLLAFENQPFLYYLVLRAWCFLGFGATDFGLRVLGLVIGLILISAVWISGWVLNRSAPLLPLAFFALNKHTLRADALRPHGLALVWVILAFAFIWQLTFQSQPRRRTIVLAGTSALLSVQTGFLNVSLLVAICCGSTVVLVIKKAWWSVALVLMIGTIAAASLLPYVPMFVQARDWNRLQVMPLSIKDLAVRFWWVSTNADPIVHAVVLGLLSVLLAVAIIRPLRKRVIDRDERAGEQILFSAVVCVAAVIGTGALLWLVGFPPARRYYLPLIAVIALSAGVVAAALRNSTSTRLGILVGSLLLAFAFVRSSFHESKIKFGNCDLAADAVARRAEVGDLIVLTRFDYAISFQRYYRGAAAWQTLPPISDYRVFRWDLVKQAMIEVDPIHALLDRVESALRSGHKVFIVGQFGSRPDQQPSPLPPAPATRYGWMLEAYLANWRDQIAYLISRHALTGERLTLPGDELVDPIEKMNVSVVSGWR